MIFEPFGLIHQSLILTLLIFIASFWFLQNQLCSQVSQNNKSTYKDKFNDKLSTSFQQKSIQTNKILSKKATNSDLSSVQFFKFPIINFLANCLIGGLFGHFLFYFGGHFLRGTFTLNKYLPLHICNLSVYLLLIALVALRFKKTWSQNFATLTYYWSLIPATLALAFPDLQSNVIFSFEFVEFFWSHFLIVLSCFFLFFFADLRIKYSFVFKAIGILMVFGLIFIYPLNILLGSNYMYLNRLTESGPMSFFPKPPFHLGVFALLLLIFYTFQFGLLRLNLAIYKNRK